MAVELNPLAPTVKLPATLEVAPAVLSPPPSMTLPLIVQPEELKPPSVKMAILAIGKPVCVPVLSVHVAKVDGDGVF